MNGLQVNQATYDEVIELIRRTPKSSDIILMVKYVGQIPVQEKSGEPIKWVAVDSDTGQRQPLCLDKHHQTPDTGGVEGSFTSSVSSEESGLELDRRDHQSQLVCSSGPNAANWMADDESLANSAEQSAAAIKRRQQHHQHQINYQDADSAASSHSLTLTSSSCATTTTNEHEESCSSSSGCSISISSVQSSASEPTPTTNSCPGSWCTGPEPADTRVRVPGGRRTTEPFGCGVVKGPDEWPGIFVQNVKPASLAERVGLEPGDQLVQAEQHLLSELPFESAIGLIKQLQQSQDEMLLIVRKGAALRHLASCRQHSGARPDKQQADQRPTTDDELQPGASVAPDNGAETGTEREQQAAKTPPARRMARSVPAVRASGAAPVPPRGPPCSAPVSPAESDAKRAAAQRAEDADLKQTGGHSDGSNSISRSGAGGGAQNRPASSRHTATANADGSQTRRRALPMGQVSTVRVRHRMAERLAGAGPDSQIGTRMSRLNEMALQGGAEANESLGANSRLTERNAPEAQAPEHLNGNHSRHQHHHHRLASPAGVCPVSGLQSASFELNQRDTSIKLTFNQRDSDQNYGSERHMMIAQDNNLEPKMLTSLSSSARPNRSTRCVAEQEQQDHEEQIRIVRQNCKLHHHHSVHNLMRSSRFANESGASVVANTSRAAGPTSSLASKRQRQLVVPIRRRQLQEATGKMCQQAARSVTLQLDNNAKTIYQNNALPLQRYVSMDSLHSGAMQSRLFDTVSKVPSTPIQLKHRPPVQMSRPARPISRQEATYSQAMYARPLVDPDWRAIYPRSNSVLGQHQNFGHNDSTSCCSIGPLDDDLGRLDDTTSDFDPRHLASSVHTCICQRRPPLVAPLLSKSKRCQSKGMMQSSLALSRFKARSEDKLNLMNINLSYVKIASLNQCATSSGPPRLLARHNQRPRLLARGAATLRTHLPVGGADERPASPECCAGPALSSRLVCAPSCKTVGRPMFNYTTTNGLISAPALGQQRVRPPKGACCPAAVGANTTLCQMDAAEASQLALGAPAGRRLVSCSNRKACSSSASVDENGNDIWPAKACRYACCSMVNLSAPRPPPAASVAASTTTTTSKTLHHHSIVAVCCAPACAAASRRELKAHRKSAGAQRPAAQVTAAGVELCNGASTDSSGYQSAGERPLAPAASHLLELCGQPGRRVLAEPAHQNQCVQEASKTRDTRQRLTTFVASPARRAASEANQKVCQIGAPMARRENCRLATAGANFGHAHSSDVSPTTSSPAPSSPASSSLSSSPPYSPPAGTSSNCVLPPGSPSSSSNCSSTNGPKLKQCRAAMATKRQAHQSQVAPLARQHQQQQQQQIPRPPPMPIGEQSDASAGHRQRDRLQLETGESNESDAGQTLGRRPLLAGSREPASSGSSRLCFVDELKMLARRQQRQQQQARPSSATDKSSETDSSTLIKIINANKANPGGQPLARKLAAAAKTASDTCSCQTGAAREMCAGKAAASQSPKCCCPPSQRAGGAPPGSPPAPSKSVKLKDEQDNMRRQHGEYARRLARLVARATV